MTDRHKANQAASPSFRAGLLGQVPHLRAFARGLCGDPDRADDLVQETIAKAWSARDSFLAGTNLGAWTFRIMRNQFLNDLRKHRREDQLDDEDAKAVPDTAANQETALHISDLQRALDQLPPERREALLLVGASGFSYEEAAEICGVAVGTMKSRVARGRAQLGSLIEH